MEARGQRVRFRLPSGAEFEAEGPPDFIERERREFIAILTRGHARPETHETGPEQPTSPSPRPEEPRISWETVIEVRGRGLQLRGKLIGDKSGKDACLILLQASQKLLSQPKPNATQLAKWLRGSGYPVGRMDRTLQDAIAQGEILASGSRRARRYELTAPGRLKAHILAEQLTSAIHGR